MRIFKYTLFIIVLYLVFNIFFGGNLNNLYNFVRNEIIPKNLNTVEEKLKVRQSVENYLDKLLAKDKYSIDEIEINGKNATVKVSFNFTDPTKVLKDIVTDMGSVAKKLLDREMNLTGAQEELKNSLALIEEMKQDKKYNFPAQELIFKLQYKNDKWEIAVNKTLKQLLP